MKRRVLFIKLAIAVCAVALIVVVTVLFFPDSTDQQAEADQEEPGAGFMPRRSSAEVEKELSRIAAEQGGLPAEVAARQAEGEARAFWEKQAELQRNQTPARAVQEARRKLADLEEQLDDIPEGEERDRLLRQKRLVEEVLAKLEKMGGASVQAKDPRKE